ncbi:rhodanese-like domain-containing protein [Metallumcola ferriviriculae]|uniref:Rhodanese-like domain-containing protein n=1 Tax=Metallumcola ferriviriculae TaxID=3039180 RepID=A0AAU0UP44_9FIRM|nr:rhodanese-like domain-containing protein [Desulfitibacteraceae bacterium MK1]
MRNLKKNVILLTVIVLTLFTLTACTANGYRNVSAEEAKQLIDAGGITVVDVRTPHEFNQGHIKNSQLVSIEQVAETAKQWPKDTKLLMVCASGSRSGAAAEMLAEKGYTEVYNLAGGVYQWPYGLVN